MKNRALAGLGLMTQRVRWQVSDSNMKTDECASDSLLLCVCVLVCVLVCVR